MKQIVFGKWTVEQEELKILSAHSTSIEDPAKDSQPHAQMLEYEINLYFAFEGTMYKIAGSQKATKHKLVTTNSLKKLKAAKVLAAPRPAYQPQATTWQPRQPQGYNRFSNNEGADYQSAPRPPFVRANSSRTKTS